MSTVLCGHPLRTPKLKDVYRWPVIIPPGTKQDLQILHETAFASFGDGWRFLLEHGKALASNYGVKPEKLILGMSNLVIVSAISYKFRKFASLSCWHRPNIRCK